MTHVAARSGLAIAKLALYPFQTWLPPTPGCFLSQLYVRAMADYWPLQDPAIPCADAGLPFKKGEILQIVDQNDALWWQARKVSDLSACAGLIPSNHLLKR